MIDGYDFDRVTARLYTGAAPADEGFIEALVGAGITHIIDVTDEHDDTSLLATHPSIVYCYNPTADDGSHKPPEWFGKSLTFGLPALAQPHARIYTHCTAGINRGPSTAYALLRAVGFAGNEALALLKAKRPKVRARYSGDADEAIGALGYE